MKSIIKIKQPSIKTLFHFKWLVMEQIETPELQLSLL